jgi:DNA-binding MarR family transcriptional regulator
LPYIDELYKSHDVTRRRLAEELGAIITRLTVLLRQASVPAKVNLAQARTLLALRDGGPQRVTSLARLEHLTQPTMSALVGRMQRLGWARRAADDVDRRAVLVRLTNRGNDVLDRILTARTAVLQSGLETLSPSERAALARALPVLHKLIQHAQRGRPANRRR